MRNHFAVPKALRQQFVGDVGKFLTLQCQVSSGCCIPKVIKISWFFRVIQKI